MAEDRSGVNMNDELINQQYNYACSQYERGDYKAAIETIRRVLSAAPDFAVAHALLALCLLHDKRAAAAEHEIRLALQLDPEDYFNHYVLGRLWIYRHQPAKALASLDQAISLNPAVAAPYLAKAELYVIDNMYESAEREIQSALSLEPESLLVRTWQARIALQQGKLNQALSFVDEVLREEPQNVSALCIKGHILLRAGDVEDARQHAIWALQVDASEEQALQLLVAIKAKSNLFLGLWWRYAVAVSSKPLQWQLLVLVGMYVIYRFGVMILADLGQPGIAVGLQMFWLAFVIYTWVSPAIFQKMMKAELEPFELSRKY